MSMSELQVGAGDALAPEAIEEQMRAAQAKAALLELAGSNVQFHILEWDDPATFARDFRICESIYGRTASDLDVERAYARYKKLAVAE